MTAPPEDGGAPGGPEGDPVVVALVPAKDRADSVAATVEALAAVAAVDRVLVVDDGSRDGTAAAASAAGAEVLRLPVNRGKGGAVLAGVAATPDADVYLLIDADLASTAGAADLLLDPVLADEADLVVGVLPPAGGRGGGGRVKRMAGAGIRRATGREVREPLSGQRAVRAELLRDLRSAERFGLEVAMTIDAERAGARIVEVDVPMDHRHTGGSLAGVVHRARQGADIVRALWPRLTTRRQRLGVIALTLLLALVAGAWQASGAFPDGAEPEVRPERVVVFAMNPLGFDDLDRGLTPNLDRAIDQGAMAAMSVRTSGRVPRLAEGYVSLGAGYRLRAPSDASIAYPSDEDLGAGTAAEVLASRTGGPAEGAIAVVGAPNTLDVNASATITSHPGALGDALAEAGLTGAVVGNGDRPAVGTTSEVVNRPAALALMGRDLTVPVGTVDASLLDQVPGAPYGVRSSAPRLLEAIDDAAARAEVVFVDPGDLDRAERFRAQAAGSAQVEARLAALRHTDAVLGDVLDWADEGTLVLITSVAAPGVSFRLTPLVAVGPGVPHGHLVSPSTQRSGLVALTDLAPTILEALGAEVPSGMPGRGLEHDPGDVDLAMLRDFDRGTNLRERTYYGQAVWYIVFQAVISAAGALVISRRVNLPRTGPVLRMAVLMAAAYPLVTFLFRALPWWTDLGAGWGAAVQVAMTVAVAAAASRARRTPLSPLSWILGATVAVICVDAATGTWLHVNSWLGYSLHSAGRFYGIPNTTFAVLGASAILLVCAHVHHAARRPEAVATAAAVLVAVAVANGAPGMGGDVGGIITFVPVFGLLLWALSGRPLRARVVALVGLATFAAVALAAAIDLSRPVSQRTHLGLFASDLLDDGVGELVTTFLRKQDANLRILQVSIWTWLIPIVAAFVLYVLVYERQGSTLLPRGSALRAGVVAVVSGSLLGFLANDSGPIVIALFFAYLGPFLTLLALDGKWGRPALVPPRAPGADPPAGSPPDPSPPGDRPPAPTPT